MLLLLVLLGSALGQSTWTARLDPPVAVADNRAIRLDVQTSSILLRAKITKLVACSAVDKPLVAYDPSSPDVTGCGTPGFMATQIFPVVPETERAVPDLFRVRQRARSMFIKRRLLDVHSPSVWLQATIEVRDEHGLVVEPAARVEMVRFQVPERALAIGSTLPPLAPPDSVPASIADSVLRFLHLRSDEGSDSVDEALRDYDELDGREDLNNGTSTRFYNHVHWSSYTAILFGGLFAVVLVVFAFVRWARSGRRRSKDHTSDDEVNDLEAGRARRIRKWAAQAQASGLYHTDPF